MTIQNATAQVEDGCPILRLVIDGHPGAVIEPKASLLDAGIVVVVDAGGEPYWQQFSAEARLEGARETTVPGGIRDAGLVAIAKRFADGELGNLLADEEESQAHLARPR